MITETDDLEYRYLEFDTPLPTPLIALPPGPGQSPPPECPSLEKYTSPFSWSQWRKTWMTWISCAVTLLAGLSAGEASSASTIFAEKWDVSLVVANLSITIFCVGFALAPMVLAPLSEVQGRRPIFLASGVVFIGMKPSQTYIREHTEWRKLTATASLIGTGGTHLFSGLLVARFFQGVGACTYLLCIEVYDDD